MDFQEELYGFPKRGRSVPVEEFLEDIEEVKDQYEESRGGKEVDGQGYATLALKRTGCHRRSDGWSNSKPEHTV